MKKLLAMILALAMTLSLIGCSSSSDNNSASSNDDAASISDSSKSVGDSSSTEDLASDIARVKDNGKLVVGITEFEPMDYKNADGEWVGFDADMAKLFADSLGVEAEFVVIDWDNKIVELDGYTVDCIWNGMTLTDEVTSAMDCSEAYMNNAQVVVVKADMADQANSLEAVHELSFAAESGSAGESALIENKLDVTPVLSQADALMEVSTGSSDAAVIDLLMADAMIGEGTSYENLTTTINLNTEEYGVGFRKGSDLLEFFNQFIDEQYASGTISEVAEQYNLGSALISDKMASVDAIAIEDASSSSVQ